MKTEFSNEKGVLHMVIGIDIGGTKCALTRATDDGRILQKIRFETASPQETLDRILDGAKTLGAKEADAIGISCGGPLDSRRGIILSPPNLPGWDHVPIVSLLEERFCIPAFLQNDANACALAEWQFGAGRGSRNMIFLTFGTGLGAGLILDGRLYEGTNQNAGEVGHLRLSEEGPVGYGKRGSFEGFCSGGGLAQQGRIRALECFGRGRAPAFCPTPDKLDAITAKQLAAAADAGDPDALAVWRVCAHRLGAGLSVLIDLFNPERIVLGSIYTHAHHLLEAEMQAVLQEECLPLSLSVCKILPAELGDGIGDMAAISVALRGKEHTKC